MDALKEIDAKMDLDLAKRRVRYIGNKKESISNAISLLDCDVKNNNVNDSLYVKSKV